MDEQKLINVCVCVCRSLIKRRLVRSSCCLRRLMRSCMRGEEEYSRMSVNCGHHDSLIYGAQTSLHAHHHCASAHHQRCTCARHRYARAHVIIITCPSSLHTHSPSLHKLFTTHTASLHTRRYTLFTTCTGELLLHTHHYHCVYSIHSSPYTHTHARHHYTCMPSLYTLITLSFEALLTVSACCVFHCATPQ